MRSLFVAIQPTLIFTNRYYIREIDFRGHNSRLLVNNLTNAVALDFDYNEKCLYWSDVTALGSSLKRLCENSTEHEVNGLFNTNIWHV